MTENVFHVNFVTQSPQPCIVCKQMAWLSPFVELSTRLVLPDVDRYRPHGGCNCRIWAVPVGLQGGDKDDYYVTDLTGGNPLVEASSPMPLRWETNASYTTQRTVTVQEDRETSIETQISTSATIKGDMKGVGASLAGSITAGSSSTSSISGSQEVTLDPRQMVQVLRAKVKTTTPVWGILRETKGTPDPSDDRIVADAHFVGYVIVEDAYNVLGSVATMP